MQVYPLDTSTYFRRRNGLFILAITTFIGYTIGILIAFKVDNLLFLLMRRVFMDPVSIASLLITVFLPFLFTAIAVLFSRQQIFLLFNFLKSISFGFCLCILQCSFGRAGWLFQIFLFFTDGWVRFVLYWFWIRNLTYPTRSIYNDLVFCLIFSVLICVADYCLISPFMAMLF